jgi:hypothetical protein
MGGKSVMVLRVWSLNGGAGHDTTHADNAAFPSVHKVSSPAHPKEMTLIHAATIAIMRQRPFDLM